MSQDKDTLSLVALCESERVAWMPDGSPHSLRFKDRYRSRSGGLAQAMTVFLAGAGLPVGWRGRNHFSVLETGFGLGLNFLCTWAAWEADPQRCESLQFASAEAFPVSAADLVRSARNAGPEDQPECPIALRLPVLAEQLAQVWQGLSPGIHQWRFAGGRVQLMLAVGDVQATLQDLDCQADAVYLDGFSPALNPQMWSAQTLHLVAQHCRPGTTLATYTVAKSVRERLRQLGFSVEKCPGLPPKRDRLQAVLRP
ncbi:MAG: tRNA (5-methylaminomethyl-2-thiouridine)(34)-methyltransferase MnmD [Comamonadaceae bacterium]